MTVFVTSLAPAGRLDIQDQAIQSWIRLGADVYSLNTAQEAAQLQQRYPEVRFHIAPRTAEADAKRPVPYIDDMLTLAAQQSQPQAAAVLINADIVLAPFPKTLARLASVAEQGRLVCGVRVDVASLPQALAALSGGAPIDGALAGGYDYFVIPPHVFHLHEKQVIGSKLAIGMPFWDYWLPLAALLAGIPTVCPEIPFALHEAHETRWDDTKFVFFQHFFHAILSQMAPPQAAEGTAPNLGTHLMWRMLQVEHDALVKAAEHSKDKQIQLADFYDRHFGIFVNQIRQMTPALERNP